MPDDPTGYCAHCDAQVVLIVWETCCGVSYNCSQCGNPIDYVETNEQRDG